MVITTGSYWMNIHTVKLSTLNLTPAIANSK